MALINDSARVTTGQQLNSQYERADHLIDQLALIKTSLLSIRSTVSTETTIYSSGDLADVDAVISNLATRIQSLLA